VVFGMVQDYNGDYSGRTNAGELDCPPLAWLRSVWDMRQRSLQLAMQGKGAEPFWLALD